MILHELLSYDVLRVIWWLLLGILLVGFAVTDGFDLGAAALLRATGKTDVERRVVINAIGPVWEGNQVWLILGGGAIFAAWPQLYAISFSGFYLAMFAVLVCLILRPVAFKFRSKREGTAWRNGWDWVLTLSGWGAALVFAGCATLALAWFALSLTMSEPPYVSSLRIVLPEGVSADAALEQRIRACEGVSDVLLAGAEHSIYVKVDTKRIGRSDLERLVAT